MSDHPPIPEWSEFFTQPYDCPIAHAPKGSWAFVVDWEEDGAPHYQIPITNLTLKERKQCSAVAALEWEAKSLQPGLSTDEICEAMTNFARWLKWGGWRD